MDPKVLITDGDLRVTFPVLRSLAKRGIKTAVAASRTKALTFFSKYCGDVRFLYPSSRENLSRFLKAVQKIGDRINPCVLFPIGEWTLLPISEHRQELSPHVTLPFGDHESLMKTYDKSLTLRLAKEEGVPVPRTFFVNSTQDLKEVSRKVTYPAVIKPRSSWVWNQGKASFSRPSYVSTAAELVSIYEQVHSKFPFPLVQEYIPGNNYSVGVLCNHSQLRAICCISVQRTEPITGGNSIMRQSVKLSSRMKDYTLRLLEALEWHGVAEVEFRIDSRDYVPKLMEINGRFWGSLEVAIASGVDLPYLLYKLAVEGDVKPILHYKIGAKRRWLEGDVIHLSNILNNVGSCPGVPYPNKMHTLVNFLRIYESGYDCFFWDDPLPFFSRFLWGDIPGIVFKRLRKKLQKTLGRKEMFQD